MRVEGGAFSVSGLAAEVEVDVDCGFYFGWLSVQQKWTVASVADGFDCGPLQHRWPADGVSGFDAAGLRDDGLDDDCASDTGGSGYGWIDGLDGRQQHARQDACGDVQRLAGGCVAGGGCGDHVR